MKRRGQHCEAHKENKLGRGNRKCKGPEVRTSMTVSGAIRMGIIMPTPKSC